MRTADHRDMQHNSEPGMAFDMRPRERSGKVTEEWLGHFDLCYENLSTSTRSKYEDTLTTSLVLPPNGCALQQGFGFKYRVNLRGKHLVMFAILRDILCLRDNPRQVIFLAQNAPGATVLDAMRYDSAKLELGVNEVSMSCDYAYVPLESVEGNCNILTHEQYRASIPDGQNVDGVVYFRYVPLLLLTCILPRGLANLFACTWYFWCVLMQDLVI
jgi:hypothetical protein